MENAEQVEISEGKENMGNVDSLEADLKVTSSSESESSTSLSSSSSISEWESD